ncbi:MAG TPA: transglutaminase domain-containing protein [Pyrinomonadaceae bacterium]|nr:transglutaminase domain-containing protein [Pyrinomonadaceae bacterium]
MYISFRNTIGMLLTAFAFFVTANAGGEAPEWLKQAARTPVASYEKEVDAVVLFHEEAVALDASGRLMTVERRAIKILQKEGIRDAIAQAFYLSKFSQVKNLEAWLIAPGGAVTVFGKKETVDLISDPDDIYDEGRLKTINASGTAEVGYVFGFTSTTEDRPLFYQHQWLFQDTHPTLVSRFVLTLPQGWTANGLTFNRAPVAPVVNGSTYSWELRDLPPISLEPMSPTFSNIAPRIAVNYDPPLGEQQAGKAFASWLDVSRWATAMYEPQVVINDEVARKARDLTAGAKTELEKIQAIGKFVQNLQYISIDIGVGYGNGMKPRASDLVLGRGYGDCKDKANLMRAMLRAIKIEAYPVVIYSGDPGFVKAEWASPRQFNHCIIAVRVSDETKGPTVLVHKELGRLMIFDATDQFTPVGDLPEYLQGSKALIIAGEKGGLVDMPVTPPDFNAWNRETSFSLNELGDISGTIRERVSGQESRGPRTLLRSVSADDFRKSIEQWLTHGATAAKLGKFSPVDGQEKATFDMDIEFAARGYGQLMQNRLLVFKPAVASRSNSLSLTERSRKHPISFESNSFTERVQVELPKGFAVDEMPDPVNLSLPFGSYETRYEVKEGKLYFSRSLVTKRVTLPVERYAEIQSFYSKIRDAEQSPVVLIRK